MTNQVFLTGYEGIEIPYFIKKLIENKISILVDVRELPLSRKKGFSKNILKENLEKHGIEYVHIKELGSPRKIRNELRNEGDYLDFFKKYRIYVKGKHTEIQRLIDMSKTETICIMCFERNCQLCHRTLIADEMLKVQPNMKLETI